MGRVLFKLPLQHSDLFISRIDVDAMEIDYTTRDKETGKLLEPENVGSKMKLESDGKVYFDSRHMAAQMIGYIINAIGDENEI